MSPLRTPLSLASCLVSLVILSDSVLWAQAAGSESLQTKPVPKRLRSEAETQLGCNDDFVRVRWTGRMFLSIEGNESSAPTICMVTRDGLIERKAFTIPDSNYIFVADATANVNGMLVLIGYAQSVDGQRANFVARLGVDPAASVITRTSPYVPSKVAIASNGSIWTVGWIRDESGGALRENVLKIFNRSGAVTKTLAPALTFKRNAVSSVNSANNAILKSSSDRIALLTPGNQYLEFDLEGNEITRIQGPPLTTEHEGPVNFAISEENQTIIAAPNMVAKHTDVWTLDRKSNSWSLIQSDNGKPLEWFEILGFDGPSLLSGTGTRRALRYRPEAIPQSP